MPFLAETRKVPNRFRKKKHFRSQETFQKRSKLHQVKTDLSRPIAHDAVKHRPMHVAIPKNLLVRSVAAK